MVEVKATNRRVKHLWTGTRLPSSGCLLTVLTFTGYRDEIEPLVFSLCKAGAAYYRSHVQTSRAFRDDKLRLFPEQRWASIRLKNLQEQQANVEFMGNLFVGSSKIAHSRETDIVSAKLVSWLEQNSLKDRRCITFEKLRFSGIRQEMGSSWRHFLRLVHQ